MTKADLQPHLRRCKKLVLGGARGRDLARMLGVSERTTRNYINQLVFMGELIEIKGPKRTTPRAFSDGKPEIIPFKNTDEKSQHDGNGAETDVFKRVVGSTLTLENCGIPKKTVRFHCTGAYEIPVLVLGDHGGVIRDAQGFTVGKWSDISAPNNSPRQYGTLRLYPGEDTKLTLYLAKEGPKVTMCPNPRDVYYKTANLEGPQALNDQVYRVLNFLTDNYAWKFGAPVFKGVYHYAGDLDELSPLLRLADPTTDMDNARVHVDNSTGKPEIETYSDSPTAHADIVTLYELPERIDNITASLTAVHGTLRILAESVGQLTDITAKLINTQAQQVQAMASQYTAPPGDNRGYL